MSQTIKTYADLCEERERVKNLLVLQRQKVKDDWAELKDEFIPVKNAFGVVGKFTSANKSNPLINMGLKLASDVLLKNFILGKADWVTRLAVPFVVKNYSSHMLVDKGANFFGKLAKIFKGDKKKIRANGSYTPRPYTPPTSTNDPGDTSSTALNSLS